jgi:dolichyl-phosphate-mannose-protein mannosyltransferase
VSWKAWFFGSSDAANWITVDKTPAALWVDGLAVRLFGLSSWSGLAPQALMGVATVALLYASMRRSALAAGLAPRCATGAALVGGAALAVTPVAVLIFRFNNPDALLTLLLVGAGYATLRAVERGGTRWLLLAAALVGLGFLTKMLQHSSADFTWAAAAVGSNTAAGYQLASGLPVMAIGGFNGTDPSPTLAQFQELVAAKKIHWFVGGAGSDRTGSGGSGDAAAITRWVQQHCPATTVDGTPLYDLSGATQ